MESRARRVDALLDSSRFADARNEAVRLVTDEPGSASAWTLLARAQIGLKGWQDAADAAGKAVALAPHDAFHHLFLSRALMELGHGEQALAVAQEAARLSPAWWVSHAHLAELASEPSLTPPRRDMAWAAANRAVELAPLEASAHATCGLVALRLHYHQLAERALRRALELDPTLDRAQHNLGLVHLELGDMLAAAQHLEQAAVADPTSALAGVAFEMLVLRWLRVTHLGLAVVWIITQRMVREAGEHQGLWAPLVIVIGAAAMVLAGWTFSTIGRLGRRLRAVVWAAVRRNPSTQVWFFAVWVGVLAQLVGGFSPSPAVRILTQFACGGALFVGLAASWSRASQYRAQR